MTTKKNKKRGTENVTQPLKLVGSKGGFHLFPAEIINNKDTGNFVDIDGKIYTEKELTNLVKKNPDRLDWICQNNGSIKRYL